MFNVKKKVNNKNSNSSYDHLGGLFYIYKYTHRIIYTIIMNIMQNIYDHV